MNRGGAVLAPTAIIADIHGNADALRAVLADIDSRGIARVLNLGDVFSGPLAAADTWDLLRGRDIPTLRGNHDRYLVSQARGAMGASDRCAFDDLPAGALDWLGSLPSSLSGAGWHAVHGTPQADDIYWLEQVRGRAVTSADTLAIETAARGLAAPLMLCAHTHLPRLVRLADGRRILNPGSVGCPAYVDTEPTPHVVETGSPEARYAIVAGDPAAPDITFRALPYDPSRMAALARKRDRGEWERALLTGRCG